MQINDQVLANWRERQANVHNFLMTKLVLLCKVNMHSCFYAHLHLHSLYKTYPNEALMAI